MNKLKYLLSILVILVVTLSFANLPAAASSVRSPAAFAPTLGGAASFAVLGASTVTNTGPTILTGNLGISPGDASSVTGFPPGSYTGELHAADATALQAKNDANDAYTALANQACGTTFPAPAELGGMTLLPGVYCFNSTVSLTGILTLDAQGDPNAVWVFNVGSGLTTASGSSIVSVNDGGAGLCNVFWKVGSSATLGTNSWLEGNIIAFTSITLNTGASLRGRALALNGAVTLDTNSVAIRYCAAPTATAVVPTATSTATIEPTATSTSTFTPGPSPTATATSAIIAPTATETAAATAEPSATLLPVVTVPSAGGGAVQSDFPAWALLLASAVVGGIALLFGIRFYLAANLRRQ